MFDNPCRRRRLPHQAHENILPVKPSEYEVVISENRYRIPCYCYARVILFGENP